MKERPILFTGEMVRAILDGRKTQTRRLVSKQKYPHGTWATPEEVAAEFVHDTRAFMPPLGTIGHRLWVRETWSDVRGMGFDKDLFPAGAGYKADCASGESLRCAADYGVKWRPSIHMPRWASRIDLEITAVRVERVQEITEVDAEEEGCEQASLEHTEDCGGEDCALAGGPHDCCGYLASARLRFRDLWQSIYANWDSNPWVWVYEFRRVKP